MLASWTVSILPLLEIGHMGSCHSGVGRGRVIDPRPISGAPGLEVTTAMLHRARNPERTRAGLVGTGVLRGSKKGG